MARPMLLDVDTGVDDAIAMALATRLSSHDLIALTTIAGNVPLEYATNNTQRVATWLNLDVPIYQGMSEPLVRPLWDAREHHGFDGLGGWKPPVDPAALADGFAPQAIVELAARHRGDIAFVFVGPLTNLAVAVNLEPRIAQWVDRLVIMGGAFFGRGNVTEYAEFNIFVDPEAAAAVARAGFKATWIGLDATHQATITPDDWEDLAAADDVAGTLVREVTRRSLTEMGRTAFHLHDPLAVAVASMADCVHVQQGDVTVDVGEVRRGQTRCVIAPHGVEGTLVATSVDQIAFDRVFTNLLPRRSVSGHLGT